MNAPATQRNNKERPGILPAARVRGLCLALLFLLISPLANPKLDALSAESLIFRSPTYDAPYYRVHFPFLVKGAGVLIKDLEINGEKAGSFLVFKDGKNIPLSKPLEAGTYNIVLDYAWAGGKSYQVSLVFQPEKENDSKTVELAAVSPKEGGIPGGKEGFYRLYQVEEEAGIERSQELVTLTLIAPNDDLDPPDIVVFDGPEVVPFDILEKMDSVPPEAVSANHPPTLTLKLAMPLEAKPYERKLLLVLKGDKGAAPAPALSVSGEGLGKIIRGSKLALELHPQSGQVHTIESIEAGVKLYNKAGVIHWNPDVFVPGVAWDHSFDWNPPAKAEEKAGNYLYINSRRGPLPHVKGVNLEVKYMLEADSPYFVSETRLSFEEGQGVIAVRNDEMVLFRELFDSLIYRDKRGEIVRLPLQEKQGTPFGLVHAAPEDLGWVGLVNSREGFGFFSLRLQSLHGNMELPGEFLRRAGTYFYAPSDGNYVYWVRPLIYTWADYFTSTHLAFVPKGSFFYEKNAYLVSRLGNDFPLNLDNLLKKLRHPLRVF